MTTFLDYNLSDGLIKSLKYLRFHKPTEIQEKTIPIALKDNDILASAETGSGKTAAYLIPLIQKINSSRNTYGLVLVPTRELAKQVADVGHSLKDYKSKLLITQVVGGASLNNQVSQLKKSPQIIIGTPGRINDLLLRKSLSLKNFNFLVLDEADRMLDMGFEDQVEKILKYMPNKRQTLLFSATIPERISKLSKNYLNSPHRIEVKNNNVLKTQIKQKVVTTNQDKKYDDLLNEITERRGSILIFVRTKYLTEKLKKRLKQDTVKSLALHGDLRQNRRNKILEDFRKSKYRILIATDIASRGLDIPHIEHVINYDMPQVPEDYIHRIGRTARAGSVGEAVSFISPRDAKMWKIIEKLLDKTKNPDKKFSEEKIQRKPKENRFKKRRNKSRKYYQRSKN
tara:strand:- start:48 stop:1244 length:1197 start_codon:yes stop_codon:yes gene_type:complete